jgi:glycosyltransferase involved in cell wall biosynthesis
MKFSILIPTYNNLEYLKLCLTSIKKNSIYQHEIIVHINDGSDGSLDYIKNNLIKYTYSENNIGLCSAINSASKLCSTDYVLYAHDDMYFCPNWDEFLLDEINKINHEKFYLCGTMIQKSGAHISLDCGDTHETFDEKKLLKNYKNVNFFDHQGSHFAPHLVKKNMWDKVGGFSEEFNPGVGSDPDFNMKLWINGVRIFKGLNNFKVYHFGSKTTRKNIKIIKNRGNITFLKKWGISIKFFKKYYLNTNTPYLAELSQPKISINYLKDYIINRIHYFIVKIFKK